MSYRAFPAYKESGVPWLGQIPEHWSAWRFSHAVSVNGGQVDPRLAPWSEMTLIAPNHIESGTGRLLATETAAEQGADSGKYLIRKGQVIYSKIRPALRKATLAPADCLSSADMYGLHPVAGLMREQFLLEVVLSKPFTDFVIDASMRVAMPKINREALGAGTVCFPSLEEQDAILAFLDRETAQIDELIAKQNALIELLGERRKAVVSRAVTKGLDPAVEMKDSCVEWLGRVPAHWELSPIKWVASLTTGITPPSLDPGNYSDEPDGFPWMRPEDLDETGKPSVATKRLTTAGASYIRRLPASAVLVCAIGATLGKIGITDSWAATNQQITAITRFDVPKYLFYALSAGRQAIVTASVGNTLPILNNERLGTIAIPCPPVPERLAIVNFLNPAVDQIGIVIQKAQQAVALLRERRSALITAAVTGKIDVRGEA